MHLSSLLRTLGIGILLATTAAACGPVEGARYTRRAAQKSLGKLEAPGLIAGTFKLTKIVDGDTIRVDGLEASLRLNGMDAEETFKNDADRRAAEADFEQYLRDKRGGGKHPAKAATPLGEQAKLFAKLFFHDVEWVRVERDNPAEIRDRYDRYLAYAVVEKGGTWVNYNVECVRAGMAPYFPKYGYSRRYHADFVQAELEAKAARRGIWEDGTQHYRDYPEREVWWDARARFIQAFRQRGETPDGTSKPGWIDITHWDALAQLERNVGKEIHLLATVGDVTINDRGPSRATLSRRLGSDFPLIFFDRDVLGTSGIAKWRGEFVVVTGIPSFYENKHTHKKQLQIQIDRASQIELSTIPGLDPKAPLVPEDTAGPADPTEATTVPAAKAAPTPAP